MQKVKVLTALPGCCWICRSSNREWYVDPNISIDFYGAVYICDQCTYEIGHAAGMLTQEETNAYIKRNQNLEEDCFDLKVKVSGLEQAIDGLRVAGSISRIDSGNSPTGDLIASAEGTTLATEPVGSREGEVTQSLHDERVAELSNDDSEPSDFKLTF